MSRSRHVIGAAVMVFVCALGAGFRVHAQAPAATADADARIWEGVYTQAQAERGKAVYVAFCTRCHGIDLVGGRQGNGGGPPLAGDNFWLNWERAAVSGLFSKIANEMPRDSPGSLRRDDYADLIAYILSGNQFPVGKAEIPATGAGLETLRIVRKAGSDPAEMPNFALVQVVGCLTSAPNKTWQLTRTGTPQLVREENVTAASLKDAQTRPLGSTTVRLLSVAPGFRADAHVGERIEVRGLLNRLPDETRLDVLSLQAVGSCGS